MTKNKILLGLLAVLAIAAMLLAGCTNTTTPTPVSPSPTPDLVIARSPIVFAVPDPLPDATRYVPYSYSFASATNPSGGHAPYTFELRDGGGPPGLGMDSNGLLSGEPSVEGTSTFEVRVKDSDGNQASGITHLTILKYSSIYEGTYTGTFAYEYRETWTDMTTVTMGRKNGPWIAANLTLTLTLETEGTYGGTDSLDITNVSVSDPSFGTGLAGIVPNRNGTGVRLRADPMKPSLSQDGFMITFPNGAYINTNYGAGGVLMSFDGKTLSNGLAPSQPDVTWEAIKTPSGHFRGWGADPVYEVNFKSWSLTKID